MAVDKVNFHQHYFSTGWKCFVKFDVVENTVAAISSIEHVVCRV